MKTGQRVWLAILFCAIFCAIGAVAQQASGSPSPAQSLDQLTAPIALYPDAILFQVLPASTNVDTVRLFAGWLQSNANLKGSELQDAAEKAGFATAYVALAPFPQVIQMMAQKLDWTKSLGQAFAADPNGVFDSVQRLRVQAKDAGNLKTTEQQQVETQTTTAGTQVIVIQPTNPEIIYVPTYNPQVVYVAPAPGAVVATAAIAFTAGVIIRGGPRRAYYHARNDYWDHREDHYNDRQDNFQSNQNQRQDNSQQRQGDRQSNSDSRQSQRQNNGTSAQPRGTGSASERQTAAATSSRGNSQSASQRSGMNGGGPGYQSGSTTRAESKRGNSSLSASSSNRGGGGSRGKGGRSGGGGRSR
jgi:hypothetical protein